MMLNGPVCSRSDALNWKAWVRTLVVSLCLFLGKTLSCSEPFSPGVQLDSGEEATGNLTGFWGGTKVDQYHWRWIDKPLQWYGSVVCGFNLQCNCSNALSNACSSQIFNHFKFVLFQQWPRLEQWFDFSQVSEKLERGPKYSFKKPSQVFFLPFIS